MKQYPRTLEHSAKGDPGLSSAALLRLVGEKEPTVGKYCANALSAIRRSECAQGLQSQGRLQERPVPI